MRRFRGTTGLREIINEKRSISIGAGILLLACAAVYFYYTDTKRPQPIPKGDQTLYTVDDGRTWFLDSIYKVPPYDHEGKIAVRALVYSYHDGRQQFCPVVERYGSGMKQTLDVAIVQANKDNKPLSSIALFHSPELESAMEIKPSKSDEEWVPRSDKEESGKILRSIKAPDGSAVDSVTP